MFRLIQIIDNLPELLPGYTCTRAIGNLWSICFGVSILSRAPNVSFSFDLEIDSDLVLALSLNQSIIFLSRIIKNFNNIIKLIEELRGSLK